MTRSTQTLHKIYTAYLALWPGVAVMSLRFIPEASEVWVAKLPAVVLFLGSLVLLAAVAIYLSIITEIIAFPTRWFEGVITVLALPVHTLLVVLTSPQTLWEALVIGFIMECGVILVAITYLVFEKIAQRQWDGFAIVVLLGTAGLFLAAAIPLLINMIEHNWWVYVITAAAGISGAVQIIYHYRYSPRPHIDAEMYIILGVMALLTIPWIPVIIFSIIQ